MTVSDYEILKGLILELLDNTISPERKAKLQYILNNDPEACKYYAEYVMLCASLRQYGSSAVLSAVSELDEIDNNHLLEDLANLENNAPTAYIEKPEPEISIVQAQTRTKSNQKSKSFKIFLAYFSIAAVFVLLININNMMKAKPVANIIDSVDASWSGIDLSAGCTIFDTDGILKLNSGFAKLKYLNATVLLEAPCEFSSKDSMQIEIFSGNAYVIMDQGQKGFVVDTPVSRIVDLGTEFGVHITDDNCTEVHVIKGKTAVSSAHTPGIRHTLNAGSAGQIDKVNDFSKINLDQYKFVRRIESDSNTVSRGRKTLDLASITSGGDGIQPSLFDYWINPADGTTSKAFKYQDLEKTFFSAEYNKYINSIFIPTGPGDQISSTGLVLNDCPKTCGDYYANLAVNPSAQQLIYDDTRSGVISFNDIIYGNQNNPCILMHANLGITYDLKAIAEQYPYRRITKFISKVGVADLKEDHPCNADILVVVDGVVKYRQSGIKEKGKLFEVSVPLSESDRFLTLISADGGDVDVMEVYKRAITCDWCVFTNPVLELN